MQRFSAALFLFFFIGWTSSAEELFFQDVKVFDGIEFIESTNVSVLEGMIAAVGTDISPGDNVDVVHGAGKTLLPGLIDAHTHAYFESHLMQAAIFGVTAELDMMSIPRMTAEFRRKQERGEANNRATIFSAGAAVTVPKGHGTEYGFPVPTLTQAEDAADFVRARLEEGSDYIKIIYDDGASYGISFPTLTAEMLEATIKAAKNEGALVVAHIGSRDEAYDAVKFGIDGLVHMFADKVIDDDLLNLMKQRGVFVVPTTAVMSAVAGKNMASSILEDSRTSKLLTRENVGELKASFPLRETARNTWENLRENIRRCHEAGIPVLCGTDAPNPATTHGASMHHEMELLTKCGLSPTEALRAATSAPADHFNLADRGRIKLGSRADLVLVSGDPSQDVTATRSIERVWNAGHEIDLSKRLATVAEERAKVANRSAAEEPKLVSDFEDGEVSSNLGLGWSVTTDSMMGGKSTAETTVVDEGANGTAKSLKIAGNVEDRAKPFAGTTLSPANTPMAASDLSAYEGFSFWARSDKEGKWGALVFTQGRGFVPYSQTFTTTKGWKKVTVRFADLDGYIGDDVTGIWLGSNAKGPFEFLIDEFQLESAIAE